MNEFQPFNLRIDSYYPAGKPEYAYLVWDNDVRVVDNLKISYKVYFSDDDRNTYYYSHSTGREIAIAQLAYNLNRWVKVEGIKDGLSTGFSNEVRLQAHYQPVDVNGIPYSTILSYGINRLSASPLTPTDPIAVGTQDPLWLNLPQLYDTVANMDSSGTGSCSCAISDIPDLQDTLDNKANLDELHTQNTDTKLDEGGANEVAASDIKNAVSASHTQNTDTELDSGGINNITASELRAHVDSTSNPHSVTAIDVGLGNVLNVEQIPASEKGAANGVATLNSSGKIPAGQLDLDSVDYQGTWDAATNTPALTSSTGVKGYYYVVNNAGTTTLDGVNEWAVGDWAVFNGSVWEKADHSDAVSSVAGKQGAVVLDTDDITEGTNKYYTEARVNANTNVSANTAARHAQNTDTALRTDKLSVDANGNTSIVGELKIKVYTQGSEPVLNADNFLAMWVDTSNANATFLIFRRGDGDQVLVELS